MYSYGECKLLSMQVCVMCWYDFCLTAVCTIQCVCNYGYGVAVSATTRCALFTCMWQFLRPRSSAQVCAEEREETKKNKEVAKRTRIRVGAEGAKNRTSGGRTLTKTKEVATHDGDTVTKEVATHEGDTVTKEVTTHDGDTMTKEVVDCDAMTMEAALPLAPEEASSQGCWRHYKELCSWLPGRQKQVELLLTIFGEVCPQMISKLMVSVPL